MDKHGKENTTTFFFLYCMYKALISVKPKKKYRWNSCGVHISGVYIELLSNSEKRLEF